MGKICSKCSIEKDPEEFNFRNPLKETRRNECKKCQAEYIQSYKTKQGERLRNKWRLASRKYHTTDKRRCKTLRKYGLREKDYNIMYDLQEGLCKICSSNLTLVVDHCHSTNVIRGLLCNNCNMGLGAFRDSGELLLKAIEYLQTAGRSGWPGQSHKLCHLGSTPSPATIAPGQGS